MARYRVGELARVSGVSPRTIDFYTNMGILEPVHRSEGGHRLYGEDAPYLVRAIKTLQAEGMSLEAARSHLASGESVVRILTCAEQLRQDLVRLEQQAGEFRSQLGALPPTSTARGAARRAMQTSMLYALGLAREIDTWLSGA